MEQKYRTPERLKALALAAAMTSAAIMPLPAWAQENTDTQPPVQQETGGQNPDKTPEPEKEARNLAELVSISDIRIHIEGKEADTWTQDQTADLKLTLTSPVLTSSFTDSAQGKDPKGISVTRLSDAFKGGDPEITLASAQDKPLRLDLVFKDVKWRGKEDNFAFTLQTGKDTARKELRIYEVGEKEPAADQDQEPQDPSDQIPGDSGSYGGGYDGGYAGASDSEPVKIQSATLHIIISKYTFGGESVEAGKKFDLNIDFRNTSKALGVENILMSVETEEGLTITDSSNTFYFDSLPAGGTRSQKIPMKALGVDKSTSPTCTVSFTYEYVDGDQRMEKTAQERIAIPVTESDRFILDAPKDPEPAVAGQEYTLSIPYNNKGKATVYNVEASVEGDMKSLSPKQSLGNIDSGRSGNIDLILTPAEPGEHKFKAVIAWENAAGEEVKKSFDVTLQVQEAVMMEDPAQMPVEPEQSGISWGWILAAAAAAGVLVFWLLKHRKKQKTPKQDPEQLNALFDSVDHAANGAGADQKTQDTGTSTEETPDKTPDDESR